MADIGVGIGTGVGSGVRVGAGWVGVGPKVGVHSKDLSGVSAGAALHAKVLHSRIHSSRVDPSLGFISRSSHDRRTNSEDSVPDLERPCHKKPPNRACWC